MLLNEEEIYDSHLNTLQCDSPSIEVAIKKDKLLDERDKKLINNFLEKIRRELQNH